MKNCCQHILDSIKQNVNASVRIEATRVVDELSTIDLARLSSGCQACRKLTAFNIMYLAKQYSKVCLPSCGQLADLLVDRLDGHIAVVDCKIVISDKVGSQSTDKAATGSLFESCQLAIKPRTMDDSILYYRVRQGCPRDLWIGLEDRRVLEILNHEKFIHLMPDPSQVILIGSFPFQQIEKKGEGAVKNRSASQSLSISPSINAMVRLNDKSNASSYGVDLTPKICKNVSSLNTFKIRTRRSNSAARLSCSKAKNLDSMIKTPESKDRSTSRKQSNRVTSISLPSMQERKFSEYLSLSSQPKQIQNLRSRRPSYTPDENLSKPKKNTSEYLPAGTTLQLLGLEPKNLEDLKIKPRPQFRKIDMGLSSLSLNLIRLPENQLPNINSISPYSELLNNLTPQSCGQLASVDITPAAKDKPKSSFFIVRKKKAQNM